MITTFTDWEGTCLAHHGIKGQKWGVRRYQNPDGTLTEAGLKRQQKQTYKQLKKVWKTRSKAFLPSEKTRVDVKDLYSEEAVRNAMIGRRRADSAERKAMDYDHRVHTKYWNTGKTATKEERAKHDRLESNRHKRYEEESATYRREANKILGKYANKRIGHGRYKRSAEDYGAYLLDHLTYQMESERRAKKRKGDR